MFLRMSDLDPVFPRLLDLLLDAFLPVVRVSERLRHRLGFVVQAHVHEVTTDVKYLNSEYLNSRPLVRDE